MVRECASVDSFKQELAAAPSCAVVLANFCTTWAKPCKEACKFLEILETQYSDVIFITVNSIKMLIICDPNVSDKC